MVVGCYIILPGRRVEGAVVNVCVGQRLQFIGVARQFNGSVHVADSDVTQQFTYGVGARGLLLRHREILRHYYWGIFNGAVHVADSDVT